MSGGIQSSRSSSVCRKSQASMKTKTLLQMKCLSNIRECKKPGKAPTSRWKSNSTPTASRSLSHKVPRLQMPRRQRLDTTQAKGRGQAVTIWRRPARVRGRSLSQTMCLETRASTRRSGVTSRETHYSKILISQQSTRTLLFSTWWSRA